MYFKINLFIFRNDGLALTNGKFGSKLNLAIQQYREPSPDTWPARRTWRERKQKRLVINDNKAEQVVEQLKVAVPTEEVKFKIREGSKSGHRRKKDIIRDIEMKQNFSHYICVTCRM